MHTGLGCDSSGDTCRKQFEARRMLICTSRASIEAGWFELLDYALDGEVWSSRSTSALPAGGTVSPPLIISLAVAGLPYTALLASSSVSIDAPSSDTPANRPLVREYVNTSTFIASAL